jgi:formylglycine-generating enzyme
MRLFLPNTCSLVPLLALACSSTTNLTVQEHSGGTAGSNRAGSAGVAGKRAQAGATATSGGADSSSVAGANAAATAGLGTAAGSTAMSDGAAGSYAGSKVSSSAGISAIGGTAAAGSATTGCETGSVGCACYGNNTCNAGLACTSKLCVDLGAGGASGSAGTAGTSNALTNGGTANGGGAPTTGGVSFAGAPTTGGVSFAGAPTTGGASFAGTPTTGGLSASGGAASGGGGNGGAQTGGTSPTGGAATGGIATGGAATGGTPPVELPSCKGLTAICQGESCCTTIKVTGGTFPMGRSDSSSGSDYYPSGDAGELPEHNAALADFALDKYEVTVGRFRNFVDNYDAWHNAAVPNPQLGAGTNPTVEASSRDTTGWNQSWTPSSSDLPTGSTGLVTMLKCSSANQTWTDVASTNEAFPINCVNWYAAFAFCIWDGGWLPTEAQWEYAAAGGVQNLLYPWGSAAPDVSHANFQESAPQGKPFLAVGSKLATGGAGYFGHADLAGSMWEWVHDWYGGSTYGSASCNNCVSTVRSSSRVIRGGGWDSTTVYLRATERTYRTVADRYANGGFRCARPIP